MEKNIYKIEKELFITSDEEIQEGDYGFDEVHKCVVKITKELINNYLYKKIILTTDQDLISKTCIHNFVNIINDGFECTKCKKHVLRSKITVSDTIKGVQAIDDEFLEWFVKNPSCVFVEAKPFCEKLSCKNDECNVCCQELKYKIIIPQEQPKQETLEEVCDKVLNYLYPNCKKEMSNLQYTNSIISLKYITKWQAERMYNKEEVDKLLDVLLEENMCSYAGDELIRQFKK